MIKLKNITISFKDQVILNDININIENNGLYLIAGESGVGKTTLFNIIAGFEKNYQGEVTVRGKTSYVFADYKLFDQLTVWDNLKIVNKEINIDEYLELFKLKELKKVKVKYLSGGEKQRVAIIRSLLMAPDILLLDEITSSLDYENAALLINYLKQLGNEKIIIVISHDERFDEFFDAKYVIKDTKINQVKNTNVNIKNERNNLVIKKQMLIYGIKNIFSNLRTSLVSYLMIFLIMMFLSFICFYFAPILANNFSDVKENYNTTTFYLDVDLYNENAEGYHEYYLEEIAKLDGFVSFEYVHNINEFIPLDKVYFADIYLNYNYLTYYNNQNMQYLNEITDIIVSPTYTNNMQQYESIGRAPENENEIAIGSDLAILYFNTTNMQEIIGKEITLDFLGTNGTNYQKTYKITGVYEAPYQEFDTIYGQTSSGNTLLLTSIQMYHPMYNELSVENQAYLTSLIPLEDINDGYYSFAFTMKTENVTEDLITKIESINETDVVSTQTNTNDEAYLLLRENILFFSVIIIAGIILCLLATVITMRYRKEEYAKYYLLGYQTANVVTFIIMEYILLALLILPIIIPSTFILYNYFIEDLIYTNYGQVIFLIILITFIILVISAIIVGYMNRRKKVLSNLKGVL